MEFTPHILIKEGDLARSVICSVAEAIDFLAMWPSNRRGPFFYLASDSLQSAIMGSIDPDEARRAFETFCREAGILADIRD
jgi:hypothetical protein